MRTHALGFMAAAVAGLVLTATPADAQRAGANGRAITVRPSPSLEVQLDRDGLQRIVVLDDRARFHRNARLGKGPKFCRNGAGHPVHGRAWCRQKGFGIGRDVVYDRRDDRSGRIVVTRDGDIVIRPGGRIR